MRSSHHDNETGLHYNRHRNYDPTSGRYVSKDPIGLAGGINVFQYAPNPTGWIDPLGLTSKTPPACGCLDWSRINPKTGETTPEHVMRHGEGIPDRKVSHSVFAGDPIATTNAAWDKAVHQKFLQPLAQMVTWLTTFLIRKQGCRGGRGCSRKSNTG
nr:RHS repeat-associated core domain-containing protein [Burkholderia ubonensis]